MIHSSTKQHISASLSSILASSTAVSRDTNSDIAEGFPSTIYHTETPVLRTAPTPMKQLSGLVHRSGYKVVLPGEGADEALGGYDIFKEAKIRRFWARSSSSQWRPLLLKALYPYLETSGNQAQTYLRSFYGMGLDDPSQRGFSHLTRWSTTAQCKVFFSSDLAAETSENAAERFLSQLPQAFDRWDELGSCGFDDCALTVLAAVVHRDASRIKLVIDAGGTMSKDRGPTYLDETWSYGRVLDLDGVDTGMRLGSLSQEHGVIHADDVSVFDGYKVGDRVRILANHSCMTAAQHTHYNILENGSIVDRWKIHTGW